MAMCMSVVTPIPERHSGPPKQCGGVGNPVDPALGTKYQVEVDIEGPSLQLRRSYQSGGVGALYGKALGTGWQHSAGQRLAVAEVAVSAMRPDGGIVQFASSGGQWASWRDEPTRLTELKDTNGRVGWRLVSASREIEDYDADGRLLSGQRIEGPRFTYGYADGSTDEPNGALILDSDGNPVSPPRAVAAGTLLRIADDFGRNLSFGHDAAGRIVKVTDAQGHNVRYLYDPQGRLIDVIYPDLTPNTVVDDPRRRYLYEHPNYPGYLTGIVDENEVRYAAFDYGPSGYAVGTRYSIGGTDVYHYRVSYGAWTSGGASRTIIDPLGSQSTRTYQVILGMARLTSQTQPAGAGCGPASSSIAYDANANVASRTDFNNSKTCYANDLSRNLETARVEGLSGAAACPADVAAYTPAANTPQRKILTQWHPDWRLETRRAEPKRIATTVYNGQPDPTAGNALVTCAPSDALVDSKPIAVVCRRIEQATSDETGGSGFAASAVGAARITSYTYNRYGQVLTVNGPRTDVTDLTTYEYYPDTQADWTFGDLKQVTNAVGKITRFTQYDRNGRLLQSIDPNGVVTEHQYHPRGWLTQTKVTPAGGGTAQTTSYDYDGVGQLKRVTHPDSSTVTYTYDLAHRLTAVEDSAGNRVEYTLDAMGNRTQEDWKDSAGTLRKTLTRVVDALNRVQTVVGGVQ
jgi:YD repeat-containing protein